MTSIRQTITSDSTQYQKDLQKMQDQLTKLRESLKQVKQEGDKGQVASSAWAKQQLQSLKQMAMGWVGVSQAIHVATQAVRDHAETERMFGQRQITVANSRMNLLRASISLTEQDKKIRDEAIKEAQRVSGLPTAQLTTTMSELLSSRGGASVSDIGEALKRAALIAPDDPKVMNEVALGIIASGRAIKSGDSDKNLGYMLQVAEQARTTNLGLVATNLIPGVTALTSEGFSPQQSAALLSALTLITEDAEGRRSATAATMFAGRLRTFFKENFPKVQGADAQIEFLRQNPRIAEAFGEQLLDVGEAKYRRAISDFVSSPDSQVSRLYAEGVAKMGAPEEWARNVQKVMGDVEKDPLQQNAILARQMEGTAERNLLQGLETGQSGVITDRLDEVLRSSGVNWANRWKAYIDYYGYKWSGDNPLDALDKTLQNQISNAESYLFGGPGEEGAAAMREFREAVVAFREATQNISGSKRPTQAVPVGE